MPNRMDKYRYEILSTKNVNIYRKMSNSIPLNNAFFEERRARVFVLYVGESKRARVCATRGH